MTDSIGHRLKKARESRHLTLEQVAEETRIRQGYLRALEADNYSTMPSRVHARGFLRNYSQYLELDIEQIVEELHAAESTTESNVVFEGEKTVPAPAREEPEPEPEAEVPVEKTSAEPFWQTWLRRAKSEIGELDEKQSDVSQPEKPEPQAGPVEQNEAKSPVVLPEADQTLETKVPPDIDSETYRNGAKANLLVERMKSLVRRKQPKPIEPLDKQEKPDPESPLPEPEPELEPEPETPAEPPAASQEIINEIAIQLRRRREMLSLTLEEIERHTRLRVEIMEALEKGNFDELPSPVQTRGMLANYAGFLDLDVDALLLRFADALQARHRERHPEKPTRRRGQPKVPESLPAFRSLIAGDVVFGVGMVLLLIGFSIWGISRVIALQSEQDSNGAMETSGPSISEALIGSPVPTVVSEVTLIPAADTPIPGAPEQAEGTAEGTVEIPTLNANVNVQVNIVALERSFLRVTVDGELAFEGRTIPGNAYPFQGEQSIEILAGNGSALRVIYNQRDLGLLGGFGQIASFIYTADEIITPTPAMSPTVTNTPFLSPTPSITPSPTGTSSPTATPTNLPVNE